MVVQILQRPTEPMWRHETTKSLSAGTASVPEGDRGSSLARACTYIHIAIATHSCTHTTKCRLNDTNEYSWLHRGRTRLWRCYHLRDAGRHACTHEEKRADIGKRIATASVAPVIGFFACVDVCATSPPSPSRRFLRQ
eukprot:GHVU01133564.1.p1 GENE.GHVU01133564.1~~GHVU01133564.1.p1  ORF type:complete len:138 (+),score=5.63 GHVU01133564.1:710-1123(+)